MRMRVKMVRWTNDNDQNMSFKNWALCKNMLNNQCPFHQMNIFSTWGNFSIRSALHHICIHIVCYLIWAKALLLLYISNNKISICIQIHIAPFFFSLPTAKFYSSKWTFCYKAIRVELHVYIIMIIVRILITIEHVQWWKNLHAIYFLFLYNVCM